MVEVPNPWSAAAVPPGSAAAVPPRSAAAVAAAARSPQPEVRGRRGPRSATLRRGGAGPSRSWTEASRRSMLPSVTLRGVPSRSHGRCRGPSGRRGCPAGGCDRCAVGARCAPRPVQEASRPQPHRRSAPNASLDEISQQPMGYARKAWKASTSPGVGPPTSTLGPQPESRPHVRAVHRPGPTSGRPRARRGEDAQPQLHRDRAHPARSHPRG